MRWDPIDMRVILGSLEVEKPKSRLQAFLLDNWDRKLEYIRDYILVTSTNHTIITIIIIIIKY